MNRIIYFYLLLLAIGCQSDPMPQFTSLPSTHTGIQFNNVIQDHDSLSILSYEYIYNGGGVGIGDLNGDDLQDVVFTGNMVSNAIYLNKGNLQFEDISNTAGILEADRWSTGVSLVDVNTDGLLDIYISASGHDKIKNKSNQLFINQGVNTDGVPTFIDKAKAYGIADTSNTTHAVFFDYDNDNDLDLFLIVNRMRPDQSPSRYRKKAKDGSAPTTDRLYKNEWNEQLGHPVFTEVGKEAGILVEGFSLGVNICDLNKDGWKDVYITNDYLTNDLLYINNQDGTFTDQAASYFKHTSFSAMGNDVIDLNNDGHSEVIAVDMLPKDNYRRKTMLPPNKYVDYLNNERYGYQYQSMRNTLQANRGVDSLQEGEALFNDIGLMAGVAATDWSWTPLVADFDNDGYRDLIVTNGFPKDVTDRDFIDYNMSVNAYADDGFLIDKIPSVKIKNYAFKNTGNFGFEDVTDQWGITTPSFSNGAAYGDLDNDGDLDYVVNNIGQEAFIFKNETLTQNWLRIKLKGPISNPLGIGATVSVYQDSMGLQVNDFTLTRGYLSSNEPLVHFGLASLQQIDSVIVQWQDGKRSKLTQVSANQLLTIDHTTATKIIPQPAPTSDQLLVDITNEIGLGYLHQETDYIDYNLQPMLPHKLSQYGPSLAVSDVNNDGLEDLFIGGSHFEKGTFFLQQKNGQFKEADLIQYGDKEDYVSEELGALFFDADMDGDDDLYLVHGGYEYDIRDTQYVDRLYINHQGTFQYDKNALPEIFLSGLSVKAADYDKDGDLDLFVGGRVHPAKYPLPVNSYILRNESTPQQAKFVDVTSTVAPMLTSIGMVTDALWTDYNNDGWIDLVLAGEFMPIQFLKNNGNSFIDETTTSGITSETGWWNSLVSGDFDNDGDIDYIAGNTGNNTVTSISEKHPFKVYYKDFDNNKQEDLIPACFFPDENGQLQEYPYFGRLEIAKQINIIKKKYLKHEQLARTPMPEIFTPEEMEGCLVLSANTFQSAYIENIGKGKFRTRPLPPIVQRAPIYAMHTTDLNKDGYLDLLLVGNDYGMEVSVGRMDAHDGLVAIGDGTGNFQFQTSSKTGFTVQGDAKALVKLYHEESKQAIYIASQNRGPLKAHTNNNTLTSIPTLPDDQYAILKLKSGKERRQELYYGSSFLSQSSRKIDINDTIESVNLYNSKGIARSIEIPQ